MYIFKRVNDIKKHIEALKEKGKTIGFIPTMGALHDGHISLIKETKTDIKVCSIFVNPTQFNDIKDLEKYPRTPSKDIDLLLESKSCDILFMPTVEEIYPLNFKAKDFDFGNIGNIMEGEFRPGHFQGMANVVHRLLEIINPDELIMGQKDFQQVAIVNLMLKQTKSNTKLVMLETKREKDGLAMSSRNIRLNESERTLAPLIYKNLLISKKNALDGLDIRTIESNFIENIEANKEFKVEYVNIVDGTSLNIINNITDTNFLVMCIATWLGNVRLIDNIIIKNQ